jgi:hypothetical protein
MGSVRKSSPARTSPNELGVRPREIKEGFRAARQAGRVEKVRAGDEGKPLFRLAAE